jgi:hypothetical protein
LRCVIGLEVGLQERSDAHDAGVVDQDVDVADGSDHLRPALLGGDVEGQVSPVDLVSHRLSELIAPITDDDLCPLGGEPAGGRRTDAARRARDERDAAVQSAH